jgi:hypothetical protein
MEGGRSETVFRTPELAPGLGLETGVKRLGQWACDGAVESMAARIRSRHLPGIRRWTVPVPLGRLKGPACVSIAETQAKLGTEGQGEVRERPNRIHC